MRLLDSFRASSSAPVEARSLGQLLQLMELDSSWPAQFGMLGQKMPGTMPGESIEHVDQTLVDLTERTYKASGPVFSCVLARGMVFAEARFAWRRYAQGRPQDLFTDRGLSPLERPWVGGTTGDLLFRMLQHADLAGNAYVVRDGPGLKLLRPDRMTIVMGSESGDADAWDAQLLGYWYSPQRGVKVPSRTEGRWYDADEVAHFSPVPDPTAQHRGMSWLTPVIQEIAGDLAMTRHKNRFFEHAATPNMVVKVDPSVALEAFKEFRSDFLDQQAGAMNAYRTLFLGGGADATVVGSSFEQMDFKVVQDGGENRIAAAAGVPPIIAGFSEGLQAATYSNYSQARRRFADGTIRPLWRNVAASLETILDLPDAGAHLWYDDRDIPFLREDAADQADIQGKHVSQVVQLVRDGFTPESAIAAVQSGDLSTLDHSGNLSVQLQPSEPASQPADVPVEAASAELRSVQPSFNVYLPDQRFDIGVPEVHVQVDGVDVHVPEQRQDPPTVNVHVDPTPVTVENRVEVEPTPVTVENQIDNRVDVAPAQVPPAQVTVIQADDEPSRFRVRRDDEGRISEVVED